MINSLLASPLEMVENLEQFRFLDAGYYRSIAIDTHIDLEREWQIFGDPQ